MSVGVWATIFNFLVMCVVAEVISQETVFSLQVTSYRNKFVNFHNITFNMEKFMELYNCLSNATSCKISYIEDYTRPRDINVMKITTNGSVPTTSNTQFDWNCRRLRAGKLKCTKSHLALHKTELGVKPLISCGSTLCQCVYISGYADMYFDASRITDCSDRVAEVESPKDRQRRASYGRRTYVRIRTNYGSSGYSGSSDLSAGEIVGITVGVVLGVPILIFVSCVIYFLLKDKINRCCGKETDDKNDANIVPTEIAMDQVEIHQSGEYVPGVSDGDKDQTKDNDSGLSQDCGDDKVQTEFDQGTVNAAYY